MSYQPGPFPPYSDNVVHPGSLNALGLGMMNRNLTSYVSTAWPTAAKAIYIPFVLHRAQTLYQVGWWNGAGAQSGTREVGLYKPDGTKIISGSATPATINVLQFVDVTDTLVAPGLYYMAMMDAGLITVFAIAPAAPLCASMGVLTQTSASPLPATATFALDHVNAFLPCALLQFRSAM